MESSVEQYGNGGNKIYVIDPNPKGSKIISSEDLFIYVSLKIRPKNRSVLETNGNNTSFSSQEGTIINFIGTQKDSNDNEYMSTDWTNIGGNINNSATGKVSKESFGIKSISISYGADKMPRVNIKFIDIRGASLFDGFESVDPVTGEKSNVSNYSSFFRTPYPVFELTIKGYYGKAVTYCLNMHKWTGNFSEGNFEINADFVGFSNSFLSDIIMDHVRATVETTEGKTALINVFKTHDPNLEPKTINELLRDVGNISKYVEEIKSDGKNKSNDEGYNELLSLNDALSRLSIIKNKIGTTQIGLNSNNNPAYYLLQGSYIVGDKLSPRDNMFSFRDILVVDEKVKDNYKKFTSDLQSDIQFYQEHLPIVNGVNYEQKFGIFAKYGTEDFNKIIPFWKDGSESKMNDALSDINTILLKGNGGDRPKDPGYVDSDLYDKPPYSFTGETNTIKLNSSIEYFDYYKLRFVVNDLFTNLTESRKILSEEIAKNINKQITKKIGFNPTIGTIFKILCHNVEAYLSVIHKIALNAEGKNIGRSGLITKGMTDTSPNRVYAWPMLYDGNGTEKYLGSDPKLTEDYFPEITYIENLAASIVKERSVDKNVQISLEQVKKMFPINPADITQDTKPYASQTGNLDGLKNLSKLIVERALVAYDFSGFKSVDQINDIAKFEAAGLYDLTVDKDNRNAFSTFLSTRSSDVVNYATQLNSIYLSGGTYYSKSNLTLFPKYTTMTSYVSGSTTTFFDINNNFQLPITDYFFGQQPLNLLKSVDSILGDKKYPEDFTPKSVEGATYDSSLYSTTIDLTKKLWVDGVLDGNSNPRPSQLLQYIGKVKSETSQNTYTLNNSPSYTGYSASTFPVQVSNLLTDKEMRAMMILSTYPFKDIKQFVDMLKDTSKVVKVPGPYLAWIGALIKRQYIRKVLGFDFVFLYLSGEFSIDQVISDTYYLKIANKSDYIGELPSPFNDPNLFNDNSVATFIGAFTDWVNHNDDLIEYFNNNSTKTLTDILDSATFYDTTLPVSFVSYSPNFWNVKSDPNFKIEQSVLDNYVNVFAETFKTLNKDGFASTPNVVTPKKVTDNNLKLQMYRYTKNIYDKWIGGTIDGKPYSSCGGNNSKESLYSQFRFIDRAYNDISDEAVINLNSLMVLMNNTNISFLSVVSSLMTNNNFLFLTLPVYIDYSSMDEVKSVFTPYTRLEKQNNGSAFVGMYNSGNSKFLDLKRDDYTNDGFDFTNQNQLPKSFTTSTGKKNKAMVSFRVGFGDENQSIFKNISINQEDFTDTNESLNALSDLVDNKGSTQRALKGTNLFNVYSLRSYNLNLDMMGNAMIQPLMYLQLDNVPMFHGAYSIINVSHDISPNTMTTKIRGVRQSKFSVPIVKDATTFLPLNLDEKLNINSGISVIGASDISNQVIPESTLSTYSNPLPAGKMIITSQKGLRGSRNHNGVDLGVPVGTDISSSWNGVVNKFIQGTNGKAGYGQYVIIDHSNNTDKPFDDGYFYYTLYAHLSQVTNSGQVNSGAVFAKSGGKKGESNSGNSNGPHLHYEVRRSKTKLTDIRVGYFALKGDEYILDPIQFFKKEENKELVINNGQEEHGLLGEKYA
jgi:murein DD-endopeptidase MepM/ murein hydrolase activator NlpD